MTQHPAQRHAARIWQPLLLGLCLWGNALAHDGLPLVLQIHQSAGNPIIRVTLHIPPTLSPAMAPELSLPEDCVPGPTARDIPGIALRRDYRCSSSLAGNLIGLHYPHGNPGRATLVRLATPRGQFTHLLQPGEDSWLAPGSAAEDRITVRYTLLGFQHIWSGLDHLLFVACLIILARTPRRTLCAVTGFTVAHSLTLAVTVLGWFSPQTGALEACIALSVLYVALEIVRPDARSWSWRYPITTSTALGLLHGLGFASGLLETGLPRNDTAQALFGFNLGVELGQLTFIALFTAMALLYTRLPTTLARVSFLPGFRPATVTGYTAGALSTCWLLQRALSLPV